MVCAPCRNAGFRTVTALPQSLKIFGFGQSEALTHTFWRLTQVLLTTKQFYERMMK